MDPNIRPSGAEPDLRRVNLRDLARAGGGLEGELALAAMPRLVQSLSADAGELARLKARWQLRGSVRQLPEGGAEERVELAVQAELPMICQRCLQPSMQGVDDVAHFRLVDVEPELTLDELEAEDEALLVTAPLDVVALVEDQLILAQPLVPVHAECPQPIPVAASELPQPGSPFAVLEALKRRD